MPVALDYHGSDDGAVDVLATAAGLPVPPRLNTERRIRLLAASAGVDLSAFAESDRNLLERLAGLLDGGAPFVLRLDDDGTHAATLGMLHLPTTPPAYLSASHAFSAFTGNQKFVAMPASLEGAVTVSGPVHAFQVGIMNMPGLDGELLGWQVVAAGAVSLLRDGVMIGGYDAGIYIRGWAPETAFVEFCLYDYAQPGVPILSVELPAYESGSDAQVALYIDTTTGRVGCTMNGDDQGYITAPVGEVTSFMPALYTEQAGDVPAGMRVVALNMLPMAADINEPVPAGALDCYGAEI